MKPPSEPEERLNWTNSAPMFAPRPYNDGLASGDVKRIRGKPCKHSDAMVCVSIDADAAKPYRVGQGTAWLEAGASSRHLGRGGIGVRLSLWRLGVESDLSWIGRQPAHGTYFGTVNSTLLLIMRPRILWRAGFGVAYVADPGALGVSHLPTNVGANLTSSVDIFPYKPLILSGQVDYSMFQEKREQAAMLHTRGTVGIMLPKSLELYAGYDYRRIGKLVLQGPTFGVRYWF